MGYNVPSEYTKAPDLRGRTIQRILTEGLFNMAFWDPAPFHPCATASCLAGNIVLAAKELGVSSRAYYGTSTADRARALWEECYGADESWRLARGFLGSFSKRPLGNITPEETVAFIYQCWKGTSAHG